MSDYSSGPMAEATNIFFVEVFLRTYCRVESEGTLGTLETVLGRLTENSKQIAESSFLSYIKKAVRGHIDIG